MAARSSRRPIVFRIVTRILVLNALIVFLPIAAVLLLGTYERQLLDSLERALVQQGRTLAAALSVEPNVDAERARRLLVAMRGGHEARLRILDADGKLLADSSALGAATADAARTPEAVRTVEALRESTLYRAASYPVRLVRSLLGRPEAPLASADFYSSAPFASGSEVRAALSGRYGAATRVSSGGQISVTLYSALPIDAPEGVRGVVLVSQSTWRILQDLYRIRLDVFTVFLWCFAASVVVSLFLALTIARPIDILRRSAAGAADDRGRLRAPLKPYRRRDEIGDLSRSLSELTAQIHAYTERLEGFAADVSHELRNPLASIAANCELARDAHDPERRRRMLDRAITDVGRAQSIITAIRDLSRIDAKSEPPGSCKLGPALDVIVAETGNLVVLEAELGMRAARVGLSEDRLRQLVENLITNAIAFAPCGSKVTVRVSRRGGELAIEILDTGPGFEEIERAFDRFYTTRPGTGDHLGLGLPIARAIADSIGGTVTAENRTDAPTGARVVVRLPL